MIRSHRAPSGAGGPAPRPSGSATARPSGLWGPSLALLVLLGIWLFPVGPGRAVARAAESAPAPEGSPPVAVSVQLAWRHQWQFAGFYAALEQGYYRESGLDVELRELKPGMDLVEEVVSGRADFATASGNAIVQRMRGRPIRLLAAYFQRSPLVLAVRPEVVSPKDLKGLRIMAEPDELASANLHYMLARFGLSRDDIQVVPQQFSIEPFLRGDVDATTVFLSNETYLLHQRRVPFNLIDPNDYGVALYDQILFASTDYTAAHAARVRAFVAATERGWDYALKHPDELVDLILARWGTQGKTREHLQYEAHRIHSVILPEVYPIGAIDLAQLERIQAISVAAGLAETAIPPEEMVFDLRPGQAESQAESQGAPELTPGEQVYRYSHPLLRGVFVSAPPFAMVVNGETTGHTVELMQRAAGRLGMELRLRETSLKDAIDSVRSGDADLLLNVVQTDERAARLVFGKRSVRLEQRLYVRSERADLTPDSQALAGARIAVWPESALAAGIQARLPGAELLESPSFADALEAVSDARADATVLEPRLARALLAERGITNVAERGPFPARDKPWAIASYFAVSRDNPTLAGLLDKAVDALEPGELTRLHLRWFGEGDRAVALPARVKLTDAERAEIAARPDLVLGIDGDWAPQIVRHPDGSLGGIDPDTAALIDAVLGTRIRFEQGRWTDLAARAERGEIDGLSSSVAQPQPGGRLLFTRPYLESTQAIFTKRGNPLGIGGPRDLEGRRVAHLRGRLADGKTLAGIPGVVPVPVDSLLEATDRLLSGQVDGVLEGEMYQYSLDEGGLGGVEAAFVFPERLGLVFAIRKERPLLVSAIDKALAAVAPEQRLAIKQRYLGGTRIGPTSLAPILSAEERDYLRRKGGRLTYCFNPAWIPYDYLEAGRHRGTFKDYLDLFAGKLGIELEPLTGRDWPEAARMAEERRCDLISGLVRTAERERLFAFTSPYISLTQVLVASREVPFVAGIESLKGKPIGVPPRSAMAASLRARYPDQPFVELVDLREREEGLASGRVHAVVATLEHAAELVERGLGRFHIVGKLDAPYPISVAVRNDEPLLLGIFQKAVSATTPAEHDRIAARRTTFRIEQRLDLTRLWQGLALLAVAGTFLGYRQWELGRLNRRLLAAKEAAEVADRAKGDFIANMSHELRTPLNAVLNLAALGARGGDGERLRGYLSEIERSGRSLLAVVNEILDFSRLEGGGELNRGEVFSLADAIARAVALVGPLAEEKGLGLRVEIDGGLAGHWHGDVHKIQRVLVNLLGNAVKFTDRGEVSLSVAAAGMDPGRTSVVFEVRDTGTGFDQEGLPNLFAPFRQGDNSLSRRHAGTGLGLAIVKRLVELMGGRIQAESQPGQGACFRVTLPLVRLSSCEDERADGLDGVPGPLPLSIPRVEPAPDPARDSVTDAAEHAATDAGDSPAPGRPRVLVVEDNEINREIVCELLGLLGLVAEPAADGESALACLNREPAGFDLVLMDVQMPGLDGYETTRRLRADARFADLPVIAITAHSLPQDRQRCEAAGMNDHIAKPFDSSDFIRTLGRWIGLPVAEGPPAASGCPGASLPPSVLPGPGGGEATGSREHGSPPTDQDPAWVDRELGLCRIGGDRQLYSRLARELVDCYLPRLALLDPGAGVADPQEIRRTAHMLRGTAPMLGAVRLGVIAGELDDRIGREGQADPQAVAALRDGLTATLAEMRTLAGGAPTPEPVSESPIEPIGSPAMPTRAPSPSRAERQGNGLLQDPGQDPPTGLPSRRHLEAYLAAVWERLAGTGEPLSVLMIAADDGRGPDAEAEPGAEPGAESGAGDEALGRIAGALRDLCRGDSLVGRYGGEELLCVMPGADLSAARETARLAAAAVRALHIPREGRPGGAAVTLSIGVHCCRPRAGGRPGDCIAVANRWLERAKSEGPGLIRPWSDA